jgi:NADPH:quinone reductase-like Zn-dependent oxidoreductase
VLEEIMRQVWITGKGSGQVLEIRETRAPEPAPGQVRVTVAAAGVNFADVMMRLGLYPDAPALPAVPGYEVAGTVDQVGAGVEGFQAGQPVVGMCNFGGYSEQVCLPADLVFGVPEGLELIQAAAIPVNYLTAWQMLKVMAPIGPGDTVLVHSAAGGVGQAAVQICRLAGARVLGTASPRKHDLLREQGLNLVLDSQDSGFARQVREATGGRGADVVLEPRNGPWIMESYKALAKCGRLVLFGFSHAAVGKGSGTFSALRTLARVPWLALNPIRLMNDNKSVAGVNLGRMWDQSSRTATWMADILRHVAAKEMVPTIDQVFPFARAADAQARLENRLNVGKVLLVPTEEMLP